MSGDLDSLLSANADKIKGSLPIRPDAPPEKISPGQFNYLMGLGRDYLPDGHSKQYSQRDVMFDVLREWYARPLIERVFTGTDAQEKVDFRELTKREGAAMINWLLDLLGRPNKFETAGKSRT